MYLAYEAKLAASPGPNIVKYENSITAKYPAVVISNVTPIAMLRVRFRFPFSIVQITKKNPQTIVQYSDVREAE
jgi:hypothetical protein